MKFMYRDNSGTPSDLLLDRFEIALLLFLHGKVLGDFDAALKMADELIAKVDEHD